MGGYLSPCTINFYVSLCLEPFWKYEEKGRPAISIFQGFGQNLRICTTMCHTRNERLELFIGVLSRYKKEVFLFRCPDNNLTEIVNIDLKMLHKVPNHIKKLGLIFERLSYRIVIDQKQNMFLLF